MHARGASVGRPLNLLIALGIVLVGLSDLLVISVGLREPEFAGAVVGVGLVALIAEMLAVIAWLRGHRWPLLVVAALHLGWGLVYVAGRLSVGEMPRNDSMFLVLGGVIVVAGLAFQSGRRMNPYRI